MYQKIQEWIKSHYGKTVKTCWIAHVKELNGLPMRQAPNRKGRRKYPCPNEARPLIEEAMRDLGVLHH
jgi:hypothetical protein